MFHNFSYPSLTSCLIMITNIYIYTNTSRYCIMNSLNACECRYAAIVRQCIYTMVSDDHTILVSIRGDALKSANFTSKKVIPQDLLPKILNGWDQSSYLFLPIPPYPAPCRWTPYLAVGFPTSRQIAQHQRHRLRGDLRWIDPTPSRS